MVGAAIYDFWIVELTNWGWGVTNNEVDWYNGVVNWGWGAAWMIDGADNVWRGIYWGNPL